MSKFLKPGQTAPRSGQTYTLTDPTKNKSGRG